MVAGTTLVSERQLTKINIDELCRKAQRWQLQLN
jgi:hypothetical protein